SSILASYFVKKVITIDCYMEPSFNHRDVQEWLSPYNNIYPFEGISYEYANIKFDNNSIDVLFQDAGHSYGEVVRDFDAYISKMKKDGIIIFHDYKYMIGQPDKDVRTAVDDIIKKFPVKDIETTGWCKVIQV
ncbi:MAG: class I SAM-dependent methyltransferase, partial [Candidatus Hodarchaeota archaeon]